MSNFLVTNRNFHRQCSNSVRSTHDIVFRSILSQICQGSSHMNLDTFCHTFTHLHIMLTAHIFLNIGCQIISGDTDRIVRHNTSQWNNRNFGRTTTYIYNHITFRSFYIQSDTDSSCHWLKNQIYITSARMFSTIAYCSQLYFSRTRRNTNHHTKWRSKQTAPRIHFLYQTTHHLLARIKVGNHTITKRAHSTDVWVFLFIHQFCTFTDSNHFVSATVECYHRWLIHYNLVIAQYNGIGSSKIHCYFLCKRK